MMILAYYIFIGLLSSTSVQMVQLSLSKAYVNTSDSVTITCSVAVVISDTVVISKDGINIFRCPSPPISCSNLGSVSAYSAVQNKTAGTTTMTISGSNISRDAGNWICQYGINFTSTPVSLAVVAPPRSSRLIEETGYIILELICTYPYTSLDFQYYLGNDSYSEGITSETVINTSCTSDYEASINYTRTFPQQHPKPYSGTFNIFVNNGFYIARFIGAKLYNFTEKNTTSTTASTVNNGTTTSEPTFKPEPTPKPGTTPKPPQEPLSLPLIIGICAGGTVLIIIIIIVCCCCKCCWLYKCRKERNETKYGPESKQISHSHDAKNDIKAKVGTPDSTYGLSNTPHESSIYAAKQTSTPRNNVTTF